MDHTAVDNIERDGGTGSRNEQEDWIDQNTTAKYNAFAGSQTTFRPDDAPPHLQKRYRRLKEWHNDKWSADRTTNVRRQMMIEDAEAFCDILDMDEYEVERVTHIIAESDMSSNNFGGKPYEKVIVAICSLVGDENTTNIDNRVLYHENFDELLEHVDMSRSEHTRLRQAVRERTAFKQSEE